MAHSVVKVAREVLDHPDHYPEVIVTQARYLMDWSDARRAKIRALWARHAMLQRFLSIYRSQPLGATAQRRSMAATAALRAEYTPEEVNALHVGKNMVNATYKDLMQGAAPLQRFYASLDVLKSTELPAMLRFLACVNAERKDNSLESVRFLRWAGASYTAEILAWRLVRAQAAS